IDETQEFVLFAREHLDQVPSWWCRSIPRRVFPRYREPRGLQLELADIRWLAIRRRQILETNHERTLSVPYVFRNHLISGERDRLSSRELVRVLMAAAAGCRKPSLWQPRARM